MPTPAEGGGLNGSSALTTLLADAIKNIYWVENKLVMTLPALRDQATTPQLKMVIQQHLVQTQNHVTRLEEVFLLLGVEAQGNESKAMSGLLEDCDTIVNGTPPGSMTRDAGIIMAAQQVEHFEIATYGSLVELSRTLGFRQIAGLLHATLDEEKMADQGLSLIARTGINWSAEHEPVDENSNSN